VKNTLMIGLYVMQGKCCDCCVCSCTLFGGLLCQIYY